MALEDDIKNLEEVIAKLRERGEKGEGENLYNLLDIYFSIFKEILSVNYIC